MLTLIWKALLQNITLKTQKYCGKFINPAKKFEKVSCDNIVKANSPIVS
jgi:hypothetical protein